MGRFFHIAPSTHSIQRAAERTGESVAYFIHEIRAHRYYYMGKDNDGQKLCVKFKGSPYRVVVNEDMTKIVTVYAMTEEQIKTACWNIAGFELWLG